MHEIISRPSECFDEGQNVFLASFDIENLLPWCDIIALSFKRKHYYNKEIELNDYKNSAVVGLFHALKNYDPQKGKLRPYCFNYMFHELNKLLVASNGYQMKKINVDIYVDSEGEDGKLSHIDDFTSELLESTMVYDSVSTTIETERVFTLLKTLTEEQRVVLVEHYYNHLTLKEISELLSLSPSRISQIHRVALKALNRKLNNRINMDGKLSYIETLNLAAYSVKCNDLTSALKLCKSFSVEGAPDQRLSFIHAAILNQLGMYEDAIHLYQLIIERGYENELVHFQLGVAYFFNGDTGKAQKVWVKAPYFEKFYIGLGLAQNHQYPEAIRVIQSFILMNKEYPDVNADATNLIAALEAKVELDAAKGGYQAESISANQDDMVSEDDAEPAWSSMSVQHDVASLLSIYRNK
ncbi:sigma-70 family RNA polymerase sigma factor [Vibrio cholerae]|nr:sigma-70 family RNA polymerase sigma factor [Vibrio cholerae]EJY0883533.1 sigma-70 family RNA polymerase sigma factor [Vibrio cholerae]